VQRRYEASRGALEGAMWRILSFRAIRSLAWGLGNITMVSLWACLLTMSSIRACPRSLERDPLRSPPVVSCQFELPGNLVELGSRERAVVSPRDFQAELTAHLNSTKALIVRDYWDGLQASCCC
jgi:hypothetical protein